MVVKGIEKHTFGEETGEENDPNSTIKTTLFLLGVLYLIGIILPFLAEEQGNESATHMKDLKGSVTGGKNSENQQFSYCKGVNSLLTVKQMKRCPDNMAFTPESKACMGVILENKSSDSIEMG